MRNDARLLLGLAAASLSACSSATTASAGGALAEFIGVVAALAVVLALAYGAIRVMRAMHLKAGGGPEITRFVRALPLGPRERLVVVVHRDEELLLGVTAGQITLLDRRPSEAPPPLELGTALAREQPDYFGKSVRDFLRATGKDEHPPARGKPGGTGSFLS